MERNEFTDALSDFLGDEAREDVLGDEARSGEVPKAPLNNFFGDDFLTLLYFHKGPCAHGLERHRKSLETVAHLKAPRHRRIEAALALGRFMASRHAGSDFRARGTSHPTDWFLLARQLGSVVGGLAYADALLAENEQEVQFCLDRDPLPRLVRNSKSGDDDVPHPSEEVCQAWYLGARTALRHVQRGFTGWDAHTFDCALACIVNYLTLLPGQRLTQTLPLPQRRAALAWLKPLWNRLITAAPKHGPDPQAYRVALIEQQLAVFMRLDDLENGGSDCRQTLEVVDPPVVGGDWIVVIRSKIPDTSDRPEMEYLKRYEVLRRPVALTALPDLTALGEIRRKLEAEFPWASDAIEAVMSDLLARRRHGVVRLGLSPVLLVGLPGTGKTRFAQRLSDLLGTPNTVVNLAGMSDVKLLKGVTRGWASNRPSRMVEFIQQTRVANPLFVLDEIDKAGRVYGNGGDPQEALLDLLEPGNARRYQDIYLMTECDLSHCLYVATSNSLARVPEPLLSRLRPVLFPAPGPEHTEVIVQGVLGDMERAWGLPAGALEVSSDGWSA
ncbi:MAG: AAA family ATPase [Castellaniella sp.]|uniref:AAA family ATPase n=1 Tax=Castellaniella sp. TaxID=1955812 RepID=UPI00120316A7|nr:AAA family ATPase [Castellaniella sp.]TAN30326.1 MAG: AAA family ATPase [Castellaniella sp.]